MKRSLGMLVASVVGFALVPVAFAQRVIESEPRIIVAPQEEDPVIVQRYVVADRYHLAPVWRFSTQRPETNFDDDIWYDRTSAIYDYEYWGYRYQTRDTEKRTMLRGSSEPTVIAPTPPRGMMVIGHDLDRDGRVDAHAFVTPDVYDKLVAESAVELERGLTLEGRASQIEDVKLVGQRDAHRLIRVTTDRGATAIADLGPARLLDPVDVDEGDRVAVVGRMGAIDNAPVLMARTIGVDGEHFTLARTDEMLRMDDDGKVRVAGEIEKIEKIAMAGDEDPHYLARVRMSDDKSALVDFGPNDADKFDVDKGDEVTLEGRRGVIDGKSVLLVDRVTADGKTSEVAWTAPAGYADVYATPRERVVVVEPAPAAVRDIVLLAPVETYQRTVFAEGQRPSHVIFMQTADGTRHMIDLGPDAPMAKLGLFALAEGDRVTIHGRETRIGDTHVIRADAITVDGVLMQLRPETP